MRYLLSYLQMALFCWCCAAGVLSASEACGEPAVDLSRWLDCEDCGPEVLTAVVELGDQAVPLLEQCAIDGPSPARVEELRLHLTGLFLARQAQRYSGSSTSEAADAVAGGEGGQSLRVTVDRYLRANAELQRVRALQALAAIGSEAARRALATIGGAVRDGRIGAIASREWSRLTAAAPLASAGEPTAPPGSGAKSVFGRRARKSWRGVVP